MAAPGSPTPTAAETRTGRRRTSTVTSVAHSVQNVATELLHKDPPPGFFAATAEAASHAPTISEIRRGSFGTDGWHGGPQKRRTLSPVGNGKRKSHRGHSGSDKDRPVLESDEHAGGLEVFPALTEEPSHISRFDQAYQKGPQQSSGPSCEEEEQTSEVLTDGAEDSINTSQRTDHDRIHPLKKNHKVYSSGYIPPPVIPWTTSTWIGLKAFWKWFLTPFGFLVTIYGLNVVAWGGMLFLLLCNASPAMCWAPHIPDGDVAKHHHYSPAASLALNFSGKYQRYHNCNDINSPRRVWLEINSQTLNALFCVTGFGLIPWRFRDLWYLLKWRLTSERRYGRERKLHGLQKLAGIYRGWFRLPGSQTLDQLNYVEYERTLTKHGTAVTTTPAANVFADLEAGSSTSTSSDTDFRLPLPLKKAPDDPLTGIRAPPTAPWKLDFFVWSQVSNTLFQCCLCGFMWGMSRYNRPSWATGLFIALGCIIAGLGGLVSYLEGKKVKRVEGVAAPYVEEAAEEVLAGEVLVQTETGPESMHVVGEKGKARERFA